jgi:hypothetical protein
LMVAIMAASAAPAAAQTIFSTGNGDGFCDSFDLDDEDCFFFDEEEECFFEGDGDNDFFDLGDGSTRRSSRRPRAGTSISPSTSPARVTTAIRP